MTAASTSSRRPRFSFLSTVPENVWDQMDSMLDDPEPDEDIYERRHKVFQAIIRLHWITSMVYSVAINACIILVTSLFIIESVPTSSDAWNGLIGGLIGLIAGIVVGYGVQRLSHGIAVKAMNLKQRSAEVGIRASEI